MYNVPVTFQSVAKMLMVNFLDLAAPRCKPAQQTAGFDVMAAAKPLQRCVRSVFQQFQFPARRDHHPTAVL
jgi:hypothetical protein